jgi:hypothetical protein
VNPHGQNIPPAGNQNPDGFYRISVFDAVDPGSQLFVGTAANSMIFGPLAGGTYKFVEAPGAAPSMQPMGSNNGQAGAVLAKIKLPADPVVTGVDSSGNSASVTCLVPPPPR